MNKRISQAKEGLNKMKVEATMELHPLKSQEYRGNLSSKENGSLVKKMVEEYELNLLGK